MDRMTVETILRSILLKRKEQTEETVWGEIRIEAVLDLYGEVEEFNQSTFTPTSATSSVVRISREHASLKRRPTNPF